jgi:peptidoglycan/LPS O-acetylase OafA/YrhL
MASPASTPLTVDAPAQRARRWRPEIQALRAFAVVAVILYHAWPARMPGGYIGVDVFFVVSGYLILGHLGHRLIATGRLDLADFWARRLRRLAPAALLVLVCTAVAVMVVVPLSLQDEQLAQLAASAVALGNWALLAQEADYLQAGQAVAPGQHFWSLSIEEQLYVAAPLLLLGAVVAVTALARGRARPDAPRELRLRRGVVLSIVVSALAVSLALSTHAVATGQPDAFLGTGGRVWEFAAGGVLALLTRRGPSRADGAPPLDGLAGLAGRARRARSAARWVGWILLGASTLLYGPETPFPGTGALPVVAGTLLVIAAGTPPQPRGIAWLAARRPVQWVGGVSYAAYLWHWPLIVLLPWVTLHPLTALEKAAIVAATLVLAWLSTRWVENPVRFGAASRAPSLRVIGVGVLASLLVAGALWGGAHTAQARAAAAGDAAEVTRGLGFPPSQDLAAPDPSAQQRPTPAECFGAPALTDPACDGVGDGALDGTGFTPSVEAASGDRAIVYSSDCRTSLDSDEVLDCAFGPVDGRPVVLVGDSHSAVWFPALEPIAEREGWRLTVYFRGACAFSTADHGTAQTRARTEACLRWVEGVSARLAEGEAPDLVITAASTGATYRDADGEASAEAGVEGFVEAWSTLLDRGSQLVVVAEPPLLGDEGERCQLSRPDDPLPCSPSRASALDFRDLAVEAGRQLDAVILDMRDAFCTETVCPTVIGGALVYRDADHFTATFGATLTSAVDERLRAAGLLQ